MSARLPKEKKTIDLGGSVFQAIHVPGEGVIAVVCQSHVFHAEDHTHDG